MSKTKKILAIGLMVLALGLASVTAAMASGYQTPAEALAALTGQTVEDVQATRKATGQTYGALAAEAGQLDEFKAEVLASKKAALAERVAAGTMTQEQADTIIAALEANQANCDGSGTAGVGRQMGARFGGGQGCGLGNSFGNGLGNGQGRGQGRGMGNGLGRGWGNQSAPSNS